MQRHWLNCTAPENALTQLMAEVCADNARVIDTTHLTAGNVERLIEVGADLARQSSQQIDTIDRITTGHP
jgi:hypothetical protein